MNIIEDGNIKPICGEGYCIDVPREGFEEQDPVYYFKSSFLRIWDLFKGK